MKLTRSSIQLTWLVISLILVGGSIYAFRTASSAQVEIDQATLDLDAAYRELDNARRLSASLTELDQQTMNENIATRLEVLRHLGLEQSEYNITVNSRQEQQIGQTILYARNVQIVATDVYPAVLNLLDRLHNNRKIKLTSANLQKPQEEDAPKDAVTLTITGDIYALPKQNGGTSL